MKLQPKNALKSCLLGLFFFLILGGSAFSQVNRTYYMCYQDSTRFGTYGGANCWGWTSPEGVDYAIMGVFNGIQFVNTQTMQSEGFVPGPTGGICGGIVWREIKAYSHYCYAVSECTGTNDGLQVIDMSFLPDSVHLITTKSINGTTARTSHTLSVDSVAGYLYLEGNSTPATSIHIFDLTNPENPVHDTSFGLSNGIHDMYAYDDTVYVAEGSSGRWSVWNLADKNNPVLLARPAIPSSGYVHNFWPTADRHYAASTEETAGKTVKIWDISDLNNIILVGQYLGPSGLAHNAHFKGDTLYLAHYESGISVVDISNPAAPVEMARYDTYSASDNPNFNGAWGCHPFTRNGLIYASNIDGSLWVLKEQILEMDDSLYPGPPVKMGDNHVKVDIYGVNSLPLERIVVSFSYAGPSQMVFQACSTNGTRTQGFSFSNSLGVDHFNKRAAWEVATTGAPLAPGSGVILSLWFSVANNNYGPFNPVAFIDNWNGLQPTFGAECKEYRPVDLDFVEVCCTNKRGNADGDLNDLCNIIDLNFTVNRIFRSGPAALCPKEADFNGDSIISDIIDLNYIVNLIFRGGAQPVSCN